MPDFEHSLQGRDLGHLKIIAELWGVEFSAPDTRLGLQRLAPILLDIDQLKEVLESLPENARQALEDLLNNEGRLPWALFTRRYGEVREMGPARRDRERPYLDSLASATESLWYRGLIGRAFFDANAGPEEYAYIPDDFLAMMPDLGFSAGSSGKAIPLGRLATPAERAFPLPATDRILDDACTLLAGLRMGLPEETIQSHFICAPLSPARLEVPALQTLLNAAELIEPDGSPRPDQTRDFLGSGRATGLSSLARAWLRSYEFNELRLIPGLSFEGGWRNDPLSARQAILDFLSSVPGGTPGGGRQENENPRPFWSLSAFVAAIRQIYPDFQRPAGDYDSWYVLEVKSGAYLRGFEYWDEVDGALIRFVIGGPLHWLGILDLGLPEAPDEDGPAVLTAFRYSAWAPDLLNLKKPAGFATEDEPLLAQSDGRLSAARLLPRAARYQVARFCEWEGFAQESYRYRISPRSLANAQRHGLSVQHLLAILSKYTRAVPPSMVAALKRWEEEGSEIRIHQATILRVTKPEILQALRSSKAGRFLGELLGPVAVIVRPGAEKKVAAALAEMGYLSEVEILETEMPE